MSLWSRGGKVYFLDSADIETARVAETYDVFAFLHESPFFPPSLNALVLRRKEKGNSVG